MWYLPHLTLFLLICQLGSGSGSGSGSRAVLTNYTVPVLGDIIGMNPNFQLSISSINCNSLNMSNSSKANQNLKIHGITRLKSDVIFLSDIRLSNRNLVTCSEELKKLFKTNPHASYEFFFNSTQNKRGVGILINTSINFSVEDCWQEPSENALLLKVTIHGEQLVLGSIYGPNNHDMLFYDSLSTKLQEWNNNNLVLGGDWNCLVSNDEARFNLDCINMQSVPNPQNTAYVLGMCESLNISDPFRYLFPSKRDYSYIPRDRNKTNRSRLDFFLVSTGMLNNIHECKIECGLQNSLFDHKAISVMIGRRQGNFKQKHVIKSSVTEIDNVEVIVNATVAETYLLHAAPGQFTEVDLNRKLRLVGEIKRDVKLLPVPYKFWPMNSYQENDVLARAISLESLQNKVIRLNIDDLRRLQLTTDDLTFMEVLLNNIRNDILSFQAFFFKWRKRTITGMETNLKRLKNDYMTNYDAIFESELRLNSYKDEEARRELDSFSMFEILNMEKMTPAFLQIAKQTRSDSKIEDIKDDNGTAFDTPEAQKRYITGYFADIYKVKPDTIPDQQIEGCIERFLGDEILAMPQVQQAKISQDDKLMLEGDISVHELDEALAKMCPKTAGGPDGIGVATLQKFWQHLRIPLGKYCVDMMNQSKLSPSFLTASIKLIPKKGDPSKIKNWRPISLLNCCYKIISKAINNRLKKVSDKILSRAQKGFANNKFIQECLININETLKYCNKNNIAGMLLAIDQAKAFDTVNQSFMKEVYKFFGFGERFINMLVITTTGRNARIMFDNNEYSAKIDLGTGCTQGNGPSPLQFNFCQQIFIFRIEFDNRIESIEWHLRPIDNHYINNMQELEMEDGQGDQAPQEQLQQDEGALDPAPAQNRTADGAAPPKGKVEAFADDTSVLAKAKRIALVAITEILTDFAFISGLKVNFEKCVLIPVGLNGAIPDFFNEFPYKVDKSLTCLGLTIYSETENLTKNFDTVIGKLINIRNFWSRFNLSLPGRIAVAKTLMLSRIGYIGCILSPTSVQLEQICDIIYSFCKGKLNVGKKRVEMPVDLGGLGMIDISKYLTAMQCSWVKRAATGKSDLWNYRLRMLGATEPDSFFSVSASDDNELIIDVILQSHHTLVKSALKINNNVVKSSLFYNPVIELNFGNQIPVQNIFERDGRLLAPASDLNSFKVEHLLQEGVLKDRADLNLLFGFEISALNYRRLSTGIRKLKTSKILNDVVPDVSCKPRTIKEIYGSFKKGSKTLRKLLGQGDGGGPPKIANFNVVKKFFSLVDLNLSNQFNVKLHNSRWNLSVLNNRAKEFVFKFNNNLLGLNSRVHHFNRFVPEECSFCILRKQLPAPRETFLHLFYNCPETKKTLVGFETKYLPVQNWTEIEKKHFWFTGNPPDFNENRQKNLLYLCFVFVQFYVWECKLKKTIQSVASCENFFRYHLNIAKKIDRNIKNEMLTSDINAFRFWERDGNNA
jgi:exonuclease III